MRLVVGVFMLLVIHDASASFFNQFENAMSSLKNSFGKLLTDVITDVKDTIDCTILAVEHVLEMSQYRAAEYEKKCKNHNVKPTAPPQPAKRKTEHKVTEKKEIIAKEAEPEISNVSDHICNSYEHKSDLNLSNIKEVLKSKSDRLIEINKLLKRELEMISDRIKSKFVLSSTITEPSVDSVYNDLLILQEAKQNNDNTAEAKEIGEVLDKILDMLDVKRYAGDATDAVLASDLKEGQEILTEEGSLSLSIDKDLTLLETMSTEAIKRQFNISSATEKYVNTDSLDVTKKSVFTRIFPTNFEKLINSNESRTSEGPAHRDNPTRQEGKLTTKFATTTEGFSTTEKPITTYAIPCDETAGATKEFLVRKTAEKTSVFKIDKSAEKISASEIITKTETTSEIPTNTENNEMSQTNTEEILMSEAMTTTDYTLASETDTTTEETSSTETPTMSEVIPISETTTEEIQTLGLHVTEYISALETDTTTEDVSSTKCTGTTEVMSIYDTTTEEIQTLGSQTTTEHTPTLEIDKITEETSSTDTPTTNDVIHPSETTTEEIAAQGTHTTTLFTLETYTTTEKMSSTEMLAFSEEMKISEISTTTENVSTPGTSKSTEIPANITVSNNQGKEHALTTDIIESTKNPETKIPTTINLPSATLLPITTEDRMTTAIPTTTEQLKITQQKTSNIESLTATEELSAIFIPVTNNVITIAELHVENVTTTDISLMEQPAATEVLTKSVQVTSAMAISTPTSTEIPSSAEELITTYVRTTSDQLLSTFEEAISTEPPTTKEEVKTSEILTTTDLIPTDEPTNKILSTATKLLTTTTLESSSSEISTTINLPITRLSTSTEFVIATTKESVNTILLTTTEQSITTTQEIMIVKLPKTTGLSTTVTEEPTKTELSITTSEESITESTTPQIPTTIATESRNDTTLPVPVNNASTTEFSATREEPNTTASKMYRVLTTTLNPVSSTLPPEFYSIFKVVKENSKEHQEAVKQAQEMLKQYKYSKVVMSSLFNNPKYKSRSVFDGLD